MNKHTTEFCFALLLNEFGHKTHVSRKRTREGIIPWSSDTWLSLGKARAEEVKVFLWIEKTEKKTISSFYNL